jgi:membrane dipeptidase
MFGGGAYAQQDEAALIARARALHDRIIVLDTHLDTPAGLGTAAADPGVIGPTQSDLPKMRIGGMNAAFFIVYTQQRQRDAEGYAAMRTQQEADYAGIDRTLRAYPDEVELARTADDARRIHAAGKIVALIGMENASPLGPTLDELPMWHARGVRYVGITHFGHNQFGDGANPQAELGDGPSEHGGLSELGRALVAELNRLGIIVDVSHTSRETTMQAVALSAAPVIASHSGAAGENANPRNLDDEQLRAIAATDGVAQMVAYAPYLRLEPAEKTAAIAALREEMGLATAEARAAAAPQITAEYQRRMAQLNAEIPGASVGDLVDHIDHAVSVIGVDHVGIASDFEGGGGVAGWRDASETFNVTLELVRRGYSDADIEKLWGGNMLRVLDAVSDAAE